MMRWTLLALVLVIAGCEPTRLVDTYDVTVPDGATRDDRFVGSWDNGRWVFRADGTATFKHFDTTSSCVPPDVAFNYHVWWTEGSTLMLMRTRCSLRPNTQCAPAEVITCSLTGENTGPLTYEFNATGSSLRLTQPDGTGHIMGRDGG